MNARNFSNLAKARDLVKISATISEVLWSNVARRDGSSNGMKMNINVFGATVESIIP
jgi:hypothetical protein